MNYAYLVTGFVLGGCSSRGATIADAGCSPYIGDSDLSISVSFRADIAPIFAQHCATGGGICHGAIETTPYLGATDASVDAAAVLASIVGVKAGEAPAMNFVTPADPSRSYLMHKIDGDECTLAQECAASIFNADFPQCGATMPFLSPMLPVATREKVRAWIGQGAQNN